jgi:glycosyltransferase involved in cell wall biosynthesis
MLLSLILPCRNEEQGLRHSIERARTALAPFEHEIIVSDSSTDRSPEIAREMGVRLVKHDTVGYGSAYQHGLRHASGRYILMADPDGSYDFNDLLPMIEKLERGCDAVIGDRFAARANRANMPAERWFIGNPLLTGLIRKLFASPLSDTQCGLRAVRHDVLLGLDCRSTGMEYASEMVIKLVRSGASVCELPIRYHARLGESKLNPVADGLRHLRLILSSRCSELFPHLAHESVQPEPGRALLARVAEARGGAPELTDLVR